MANLYHTFYYPADEEDYYSPSKTWRGGRSNVRSSSVKSIQANLLESQVDYLIAALVPGYEKEQITVDYDPSYDCIIINGIFNNEEENKKEEDKGYSPVYKEFNLTNFHRVICLPAPIKAKEIKANLENGFLVIIIPKEESKGKHRVTIST